MKINSLKAFLFIWVASLGSFSFSQSLFNNPTNKNEEIIESIEILGNKTVSSEAIKNMMDLKKGSLFSKEKLSQDIKNIFSSGYFEDVQVEKKSFGHFAFVVLEKPTIKSIQYENFNIVSESSVKEKINTKIYTIVDEKKLSQDLAAIEKAYVEKGYYFAKASYTLIKQTESSVNLVFKVTENQPVLVHAVNLIGNQYFSDSELQRFMATKPYSWLSFLTGSGLFRDEFTTGDTQNITYYYRDNGFAEATVATPLAYLDKSKAAIGVSYYIEEGERFRIGQITLKGDLVETEKEIKKKLQLIPGKLYRISQFQNDLKALKTLYGDFGYAFAYIYPTTNVDRKNKTLDITYEITKGEKAYFRKITVEGNLKTRDNVIRRALKVSEGQLYNATRLEKSKFSIGKLGYFDSVDIIQDNDEKNKSVDLRVIIKENLKTGNLKLALGGSPSRVGGITFFGQINYEEKNLFGKAYTAGGALQLSPSPEDSSNFNYSLSLNFTNPSIFDSSWSFGVNGSYSSTVSPLTNSLATRQVYYYTKNKRLGFFMGKEIAEDLILSLGYSFDESDVAPFTPLTSKFVASGKAEEVTQTLTYDATDNYQLPTNGLYLTGSNTFGTKLFYGNYEYGILSGSAAYYIPVSLGEHFKTNFRLAVTPRYIYPLQEDKPVPLWKRPHLGSSYFMKGYSGPGEDLGEKIPVTLSPVTGRVQNFNIGGNRSYYSSAEYFIPLIPEAQLRFLTFGEAGTVLSENESFSFDNLKYDVGFGFRWSTAIAPFRFEWAFPVEHGKVGDAHFIFAIGLDSVDASYF